MPGSDPRRLPGFQEHGSLLAEERAEQVQELPLFQTLVSWVAPTVHNSGIRMLEGSILAVLSGVVLCALQIKVFWSPPE